MARNGFKVMDSDMHVIEPEDLWERYIDSSFKDRAPRGITRWHGDMQLDVEGHKLPLVKPSDQWEEAKRKILWDNCARLYGFS